MTPETLTCVRSVVRRFFHPQSPARLRSLCAVTISVHYTEELRHTLENRKHFDRWIIVTAPEDLRTQEFCKRNGLECIVSERLREGGGFNKGKAINDGIAALHTDDWVLLLDSDIVLPEDFRSQLSTRTLDRRKLYSIPRVLCSNSAALRNYQRNPEQPIREVSLLALWPVHAAYDPSIRDDLLRANVPFIGYFQMFHASTGHTYPEHYPTAGDSDLAFMEHFSSAHREVLPMECAHVGLPFRHHGGRAPCRPVRFLAIGACNGLIEWRGVGLPRTTDGDTMYRHVVEDGWRGILVEPNPVMFRELQKTYEGVDGVILEQAAIAESSGMRDFYVCHGNPLISSFDLGHIRKHDGWCNERWEQSTQRITVPCMTVEEVLRKHDMAEIDVLHIDAEGHDARILQSVNLSKTRPTSIYFEHLHMTEQERNLCVELLAKHGYTVTDANPWNTLAQLPGCTLWHGM
jgi:FkbM family methyltransferase